MAYVIGENCIVCRRCLQVCPAQAVRGGGGRPAIDKDRCVSCGQCAAVCPEMNITDAENPPAPPQKHDPVSRSCDVLILGGGGAGMVAAARLGCCTDKKIIVVEKRKRTGGGAQFASDYRIYNSKWQQKRGIPDVTNEKLREVMDQTYWQLDPKLAYNTFTATAEFFDWFCSLEEGMEDNFVEGTYIFDTPEGPKVPSNKRPHSGGRFIMEKLLEQCEKNGVEIMTDSAAVDVTVEQGKIASVVVQDPGGTTVISCKACILATGSWIRNTELADRVMPGFSKVRFGTSAHIHPSYTGDGLPLAEKAGAKMDRDGLAIRLMGPLVMAPSKTLGSITNEDMPIQVDKNGKRWINETAIKRIGTFEVGRKMIDLPDQVSFHIFDQGIIQEAVRRFRGGAKYAWTFPTAPYYGEDYQEDVERCMDMVEHAPGDMGIYRADTIRELAEKAGIDPQGLEETVARYNGMCRTGRDTEFFKDADQMMPIENGPYYAVRGGMGTDGAFGGVFIDQNIQAYAADGGVVEGLYVPGDLSSGRFLNLAGNKVQIINDLSWAFASGWIASKSVESYLDSLNKN